MVNNMYSSIRVVLMALHGWRIDHKQECRGALERYCQYLAMHGYGQGSKTIWDELAALPAKQATAWVERTFEQFAPDPVTAVEYVLREMVQRS